MCFSKKAPVRANREITNEPETDEENGNELHLSDINSNITISMIQPDHLDNSLKDPEDVERHSSVFLLGNCTKETRKNARASDGNGL